MQPEIRIEYFANGGKKQGRSREITLISSPKKNEVRQEVCSEEKREYVVSHIDMIQSYDMTHN